ncbi:hypothetical protein [Peribacillus glennii]|uniref:Uncharacterized protein n=1 Tax=Peribacillus glennii TaxID=2303991 RepID=A0A372LHC3_9BACI|nr:hypothetical protein [Peribacillus glennii]RFU65707.1 hypothetical protein D0466_07495 [Peribacillus glennii]
MKQSKQQDFSCCFFCTLRKYKLGARTDVQATQYQVYEEMQNTGKKYGARFYVFAFAPYPVRLNYPFSRLANRRVFFILHAKGGYYIYE